MPFGLSKKTTESIKAVFLEFSRIHKVRIFGSRALGRHRPGSDIDLAIEGKNLCLDDLLALRLKFEKLMLPYRFDLVDFSRITEPALCAHIQRYGKIIFKRKVRA